MRSAALDIRHCIMRRRGKIELVTILLNYNADIMTQDKNDQTPLHRAVQRTGNLKVVEWRDVTAGHESIGPK